MFRETPSDAPYFNPNLYDENAEPVGSFLQASSNVRPQKPFQFVASAQTEMASRPLRTQLIDDMHELSPTRAEINAQALDDLTR